MTKKSQFRFAAVMVAAFLATAGAHANTATVNGIKWTYTVSNGKAILQISPSSAYQEQTVCIPKTTSGAISVPSTLGGYPVEIRVSAFGGCAKITSVTIPNGVTGIGSSAFSGCSSLQSVIIGNGVTNIGGSAFSKCSALRSVTIPGSVTSIESSAFSGCSALRSVTIENGVTSIGSSAFYQCNNLGSVTIPDSVTSIGENAFDYCPALRANWSRAISDLAMNGKDEPPDPRYALTSGVADRSIATVTVNGNRAIDSFVLTDGKVFDTVLRVINVATTPSTLSLPSGYSYERLKGTDPLSIPASSTNLLTITRTADRVFFVAREELESAQ